MKGRKPKPTERKKLEGNPGKRKLNQDEPKPSLGMPDPPPFLLPDARFLWDELAPELVRMNVLTKVDGKALAAACMAYARWLQAERDIDKYGILVETPIVSKKTNEIVGHVLKKNPACTAAHNSLCQVRSFFALFGLDPSSRCRLNVNDGQTEDPLEQLLQRKAKAAIVQ